MDSGSEGGEDTIYNVDDPARRGGKDIAQSIYRPSTKSGQGFVG